MPRVRAIHRVIEPAFGDHSTNMMDPERDDDTAFRRHIAAVAAIRHLLTPPRVPPPKPACVYFIECGDFIKIGTTTQGAERRFAGMQLPPHAELVAVVHGWGATEEAALHTLFARQRVRGEWFERCPELEALVNANRNLASQSLCPNGHPDWGAGITWTAH